MSWLTGNQIKQEVQNNKIMINPFNLKQVNPNSYDYRLSPILKELLPNHKSNEKKCLDPKIKMKVKGIKVPSSGYLLKPNHAYLGSTVEKFGSKYFASLCTGKSSVGRLFLNNHQCAGLIDQGFYGNITLEITVQLPTIVYPKMRIGQIFWFKSHGEALLYKGKYRKNNKAQPTRIYMDLNK